MVHTDSVELSHPLASLLPSAEAGALAVLIGTEAPLTGRRIAELAGETTHASTLRAEGVETSEQLAQLRKMGCDMAQGYHFSRPLLAAGVADMLRLQPFANR